MIDLFLKIFIIFTFIINLYDCNECIIGSYLDIDNLTCKNCSKSCFDCFGPNENQCYYCKQNYYLLNNICLEDCPEYYYKDEQTQKCLACIDNCKQCKDGTSCQACNKNFEFVQNMCIGECDNNMLIDKLSGKCKFVCGANEIENKNQKYCQKAKNCSQIDRVNVQTFIDTQIVGIYFDNSIGIFITYDSNGKLFIWEQKQKLLIKELEFHKNKIEGVFFIKIGEYDFLVSYDALSMVYWHYQTGSFFRNEPLENMIIIGTSINYQWQVVFLTNYNNNYFIAEKKSKKQYILITKGLDKDSVNKKLLDSGIVFYDKNGLIRFFNFADLLKNYEVFLIYYDFDLKDVQDPIDVRFIHKSNYTYIYSFNQGITIKKVLKNFKQEIQSNILQQYKIIDVFYLEQGESFEKNIFKFIVVTQEKQLLQLQVDAINLDILNLIETIKYKSEIFKVFFLVDDANYQIGKIDYHVCIQEENNIYLFNDQFENNKLIKTSQLYNIAVQINNGLIYIYSKYLEVYDKEGFELYNIQPDIISEKALFPTLFELKYPLSPLTQEFQYLIIKNKYIILVEDGNIIGLWQYPNLDLLKKLQPLEDQIQNLLYIPQVNNDNQKEYLIVSTNTKNYIYSFPQLKYILSIGSPNCKYLSYDQDKGSIYLIGLSYFQVFEVINFSKVLQFDSQKAKNLIYAKFFNDQNQGFVLVQYDKGNLVYFDNKNPNTVYEVKHNITYTIKEVIFQDYMLFYKNSSNQYTSFQLNIENKQLIQHNKTFPNQIKSFFYYQDDLIIFQHLNGTLSVYKFATMNLIDQNNPFQEPIDFMIKLTNTTILLASTSGKIAKLNKIQPISIYYFSNTIVNQIKCISFDEVKQYYFKMLQFQQQLLFNYHNNKINLNNQ